MSEEQDQCVTKQQSIEVRGFFSSWPALRMGARYRSVSAICEVLKTDHRTGLRHIRSTMELSEHLHQLMLYFLSGGDQSIYCLPVEIAFSSNGTAPLYGQEPNPLEGDGLV